jgi:hypothetical protein
LLLHLDCDDPLHLHCSESVHFLETAIIIGLPLYLALAVYQIELGECLAEGTRKVETIPPEICLKSMIPIDIVVTEITQFILAMHHNPQLQTATHLLGTNTEFTPIQISADGMKPFLAGSVATLDLKPVTHLPAAHTILTKSIILPNIFLSLSNQFINVLQIRFFF